MNSRYAGIAFVLAGLVLGVFLIVQLAVGEKNRQQFQDGEIRREGYDAEAIDDELENGSDIYIAGTGRRFKVPEGLRLDKTDEELLTMEELRLADEGADYTYEVRHGDSIDSIAAKYLGHHDLKQRIYQFNPGLKARDIQPGAKIVIPFRFRR